MNIQSIAQNFYDYSSYIKGYSKITLRRYKQAIGFYCHLVNIENIEDVSEQNLRNFFFHGRTERLWSVNTFLHYHKSLLVFFRWCKREGHIENNPVETIELPRLEKKLPPKLTRQEAELILEVVYNFPYDYKFLRYRNHAIFSMFLFAGLRKNELLKLKFTDVDLENLSIFIRQGKGNKDRVVPISYTLAQSLRKYVEERKRLEKTCVPFFTSLNRNSGYTESGLKRLIIKIKNISKVNFSSHKLRHTFATLMLEGGCDIYSLSKMMGHADIRTTTIYLAASAEHLRSQMVKHPMNDSTK